MTTPSIRLARQQLFKTPSRSLTEDQHIELGYERARVSAAEYGKCIQNILPPLSRTVNRNKLTFILHLLGLTAEDILNLTPRFWSYHLDLLHTVSFTAFVLVTIQYNLVAGTIVPYAAGRPDLQQLMDRIMKFELSSVNPETAPAAMID